jgi:hypothetical protein
MRNRFFNGLVHPRPGAVKKVAQTKNRPIPGGLTMFTMTGILKEAFQIPLLRRHVQLRRRLILQGLVCVALQAILVA